MKVHSYRSSFTVYACDSRLERGHVTTETIANVGYSAEHKLNEAKFWADVTGNPPHVVVLQAGDDSFFSVGEEAFLERVSQRLPESQLIYLAEPEGFDQALQKYESGAFDVVRAAGQSVELVRAVDRACELNYFIYMNEQLKDKLGISGHGQPRMETNLLEIWLQNLHATRDVAGGVTAALREVARQSGVHAVFYLRFIESNSTLVVDSALGEVPPDLDDVGIDLSATEPGYGPQMLRQPQSLLGLKEFVQKGLGRREFFALPLVFDQRVQGIFVVISDEDNFFSSGRFDTGYAKVAAQCLGRHIDFLLESERRRQLSTIDEESGAANMPAVVTRLREEITRARRISRPVSFLLIAIDGIAALRLEETDTTVKKFFRAIVEVFAQNSRINDLVGRWSEDLFALVLPHTDKKGAAIKAERLRRIIEKADFSAVFGRQRNISVSIGASEYPAICHDAEGLAKTAESALNDVVKAGGNRVCLASPPRNFEPDFNIGES